MKKTCKLIKIILVFALIIGAFSFNSSSAAGQDVEINETNFPDANFRKMLKAKEYDADENGKLSESEIKAIKNIDVAGKLVGNLKGLEYFTELEELTCTNSSLTSLDITKNTKLKKVECGKNPIKSIDLSKNTELLEFGCGLGRLENVDFSNNKKIQKIETYNCPLNSINLKNCTNLKYLDCTGGEIAIFDLNDNVNLTTLICSSNKFFTLDLSKNTKLVELYVSNNAISEIDLSNKNNLETFDCSNTFIKNLDVSKNTKLKNLFCSEVGLRNLDVSKNTDLIRLRCAKNQLTSLNLTNNSMIEELDCKYNRISNLDLGRQIFLKNLDCGNNILEKLDLSKNTEIKNVKCNDNLLKEINLKSCTDLEELDCKYNKLENIDITNNSKMLQIKCNNNELKSLNLEKSSGLKYIECGNNKLSNLDLSTTKNANLDLNNPTVQELDVEISKKDNSLDLTKLPGKFDPSKVKNLKSAKFDGKKLIVDKDAKTVTYDYNAGGKNYLKVTMNVKFSDKEEDIERLAGSDRIATAIEVSKKEYPSASTAIIARSDIYPDSLAAASISHKLRAPILLTESNKLDDRVKTEIKRLKATNVIIVGGEKSITKDVHDALLEYDKDKNIERIAGNNRYETSAALAKKLVEDLKEAKHAAVIASGENFADALTAGAYAAGEYYPILLVQKDVIDPSIAKVIKSYEINKTIIAGGKMSVSENVEKDLPKDTQRIAGADRYETSAKIADQLFKTQLAYVASGEVFADALVTSPVAASHKTPILLVSKDKASKEVKDYVKKTIDYLIIVGGEKSVPNSVVLELEKASK